MWPDGFVICFWPVSCAYYRQILHNKKVPSAMYKKIIALFVMVQPAMALAADAPSSNTFFNDFSFSGTVAVTSDYAYRGITQNDEKITPQLGVEIGHSSGAYVGIWGSPVDFNDGGEAHSEVDFTLGYRYESGPWSTDTRYTYFAYPGARSSLHYDYGEAAFSLTRDFDVLSIGGMVAYSPNYASDSGDAYYVQALLDVPLPKDFAAHAYVGKQYVDDNAAYGYPDAIDWNLGVSYTYDAIGLDLSYIDTNISKAQCADGCSGRVVGTLSYSF